MDQRNKRGSKNHKGSTPNFGQTVTILIMVAVIAYFIMSYGRNIIHSEANEEVSYDTFYEMVEKGEVTTVRFSQDTINITTNPESKTYSPLLNYYTVAVEDPNRTQMLLDHNVTIYQYQASYSLH